MPPLRVGVTAGRGSAKDIKLSCKVTRMLVEAVAMVVSVQASVQLSLFTKGQAVRRLTSWTFSSVLSERVM